MTHHDPGRNVERGEAIVARIERAGGRAAFVSGDLSDPATPARLVAAATAGFRRLTVLVNNAVTAQRCDGPITDVEPIEWEALLRLDLSAVEWRCRAAIPAMVQAGHGSIVNVPSRAAERGLPGACCERRQPGRHERPHPLPRGRLRQERDPVQPCVAWLRPARGKRPVPDTRSLARLEGIQLTRLTRPEDVAWAAVSLVSPEPEVVTGITLRTDGGSTASLGLVLG